VSRATIERAAEAGADTFVAGSAVYSAENANDEIAALRELAAAHVH
jgi:ribulose-phosphate 3-epimerase